MKRLFMILIFVALFFAGCIAPSTDINGDDMDVNSTFDLYSEFRMGTFDPAGVQGYDFVDEDAGGDGLRLSADRGAIYITDTILL